MINVLEKVRTKLSKRGKLFRSGEGIRSVMIRQIYSCVGLFQAPRTHMTEGVHCSTAKKKHPTFFCASTLPFYLAALHSPFLLPTPTIWKNVKRRDRKWICWEEQESCSCLELLLLPRDILGVCHSPPPSLLHISSSSRFPFSDGRSRRRRQRGNEQICSAKIHNATSQQPSQHPMPSLVAQPQNLKEHPEHYRSGTGPEKSRRRSWHDSTELFVPSEVGSSPPPPHGVILPCRINYLMKTQLFDYTAPSSADLIINHATVSLLAVDDVKKKIQTGQKIRGQKPVNTWLSATKTPNYSSPSIHLMVHKELASNCALN